MLLLDTHVYILDILLYCMYSSSRSLLSYTRVTDLFMVCIACSICEADMNDKPVLNVDVFARFRYAFEYWNEDTYFRNTVYEKLQ